MNVRLQAQLKIPDLSRTGNGTKGQYEIVRKYQKICMELVPKHSATLQTLPGNSASPAYTTLN
jgi:hypothetical protein